MGKPKDIGHWDWDNPKIRNFDFIISILKKGFQAELWLMWR
jgi:hypothetical protein